MSLVARTRNIPDIVPFPDWEADGCFTAVRKLSRQERLQRAGNLNTVEMAVDDVSSTGVVRSGRAESKTNWEQMREFEWLRCLVDWKWPIEDEETGEVVIKTKADYPQEMQLTALYAKIVSDEFSSYIDGLIDNKEKESSEDEKHLKNSSTSS